MSEATCMWPIDPRLEIRADILRGRYWPPSAFCVFVKTGTLGQRCTTEGEAPTPDWEELLRFRGPKYGEDGEEAGILCQVRFKWHSIYTGTTWQEVRGKRAERRTLMRATLRCGNDDSAAVVRLKEELITLFWSVHADFAVDLVAGVENCSLKSLFTHSWLLWRPISAT